MKILGMITNFLGKDPDSKGYWAIDLLYDLQPFLIIIFSVIGAAAIGYSVYLAFMLAKAEDESKRKQAKSRITKTVVGLLIIVVLVVILFGNLVYDMLGVERPFDYIFTYDAQKATGSYDKNADGKGGYYYTKDGDGGYYELTLPNPTMLTIECWGAYGGLGNMCDPNTTARTKGGYSFGVMEIAESTTFYIYVGGAGGGGGKGLTTDVGFNKGGYNGGGASPGIINSNGQVKAYLFGGGGGGASDVRVGGKGLYNRIIVAGGGGGTPIGARTGSDFELGYGGGDQGKEGGYNDESSRTSGHFGKAGTQTSGGNGGSGGSGNVASSYGNGSFGVGGHGLYCHDSHSLNLATPNSSSSPNAAGGGGGGWYGGGGGWTNSNGSSTPTGGGGGGGSGFVLTKKSSENRILPSSYFAGYEKYYFDEDNKVSTLPGKFGAGYKERPAGYGESSSTHRYNGLVRIKNRRVSNTYGKVDSSLADFSLLALTSSSYAESTSPVSSETSALDFLCCLTNIHDVNYQNANSSYRYTAEYCRGPYGGGFGDRGGG